MRAALFIGFLFYPGRALASRSRSPRSRGTNPPRKASEAGRTGLCFNRAPACSRRAEGAAKGAEAIIYSSLWFFVALLDALQQAREAARSLSAASASAGDSAMQ